MVCSSPQWEISGNALGFSDFAGMEQGGLGLGFLTISALGLFHPLQEVKYVPSNEIFLLLLVCLQGSKEQKRLVAFVSLLGEKNAALKFLLCCW